MLGNYLEWLDYEPEEYHSFKNIRDSFHLSAAIYGTAIPLVFGSGKVNGKIIWADQIKEVEQIKTEKRYFSNSKQTKALYHVYEYEYYLSFALAICEGEIAEISRVWTNNDLINLGEYKFRLYHGSEEQMPDPLITSASEGGQAPAFRGLAYIVFENLPLIDFGNIIPTFSFEVIRKANVPKIFSVEDLVKSMVMIPGSGEFVYDTIIQHKVITNSYGASIARKVINCHNYHNISNSLHSLNQLNLTCSNIEWVAPVVCWFGDSLNAADCAIKPAVEYNDLTTKYTEEWHVGGYTRRTAKLISRDQDEKPRYGGSVNDASVVRYLQELQARSIKIMFYPMFFVDIERKPWRGHVTGDPAIISEFFNKEEGYNNFILHYAKLVKDNVNAFVIGSELIGLTSIRAGDSSFPAVIELVKLAKLVKEIVGPNILGTYAADWSEYHHTHGGWYNLDPLWSSPYIDFIGIDAYFPVTSSTSSVILQSEIIKGWKSGEGYDYFIDSNSIKQPLSPEYAWKNLKYWWETPHYNPDGARTGWFPQMKKFWFTEFGFPSIDKATNQPNVFLTLFVVMEGFQDILRVRLTFPSNAKPLEPL